MSKQTNHEARVADVIRLAEGAMGWKVRHTSRCGVVADAPEPFNTTFGIDQTTIRRWEPFECLDDAWMLAEAIRERCIGVVITASGTSSDHKACFFVDGIWALGKPVNDVPEFGSKHLIGYAFADTVAEAICKAALAALGNIKERDGR